MRVGTVLRWLFGVGAVLQPALIPGVTLRRVAELTGYKNNTVRVKSKLKVVKTFNLQYIQGLSPINSKKKQKNGYHSMMENS